MHRNSAIVSTKQKRIAALAKQSPEMAFTSLAYLMDIDWLKEAYRRTRKDGAVGVDGVTADQYEQDLEGNLQSLLDRAKSGTYKAPPVRRVHIPKGGSTTETRPLGIPTLEDKLLQRAVVMLLEPIYEQDFLDCSYGFRPKRSAHQALNSFRDQLMDCRGGYVLEVDIRKFFDNLDHGHLRQFLQLRVRDGVLLRLIGKWLNAGVMEDGSVSYPDSGSPQGGVVSPILSNVFLHYVLDLWAQQWRRRHARGEVIIVRYADDFVVGFQYQADAERFLAPPDTGFSGITALAGAASGTSGEEDQFNLRNRSIVAFKDTRLRLDSSLSSDDNLIFDTAFAMQRAVTEHPELGCVLAVDGSRPPRGVVEAGGSQIDPDPAHGCPLTGLCGSWAPRG